MGRNILVYNLMSTYWLISVVIHYPLVALWSKRKTTRWMEQENKYRVVRSLIDLSDLI